MQSSASPSAWPGGALALSRCGAAGANPSFQGAGLMHRVMAERLGRLTALRRPWNGLIWCVPLPPGLPRTLALFLCPDQQSCRRFAYTAWSENGRRSPSPDLSIRTYYGRRF